MTSLGQIQDQHELSGSQYYELLEIRIPTENNILVQRFCLNWDLTWKGQLWPKVPFKLSGLGENTSGERIRPSLLLPNPEGLYLSFIQSGQFERAEIDYQRVHPLDIENGWDNSEKYLFYVGQIVEANSKYINCQLRFLSDGNNFKIPPRRFTQPEFNQVRL